MRLLNESTIGRGPSIRPKFWKCLSAIAALGFAAHPLFAQDDSYRDDAHMAAYQDIDRTFESIDELIKAERLELAAQRIEEIAELERSIHDGAHPHVFKILFSALETWLEADQPDRASLAYAQIVADVPLLEDVSRDKLESELEQICEFITKRVEKRSLYVSLDQFVGCPVAFSSAMTAIFHARVKDLTNTGDIAAARQLISDRAEALDVRDSRPFRDNEAASAMWVNALGMTGTAAFEMRMDAVSDRMYRDARDFAEKHLPDDHPAAATTKATLANRLDLSGDHEAAFVLHKQAWDTLVATGGEGSVLGFAWANNYARNQINLGNYTEAVRLLEIAHRVGRSKLGPRAPQVLNVASLLVLALYRSGETEKADEIVAAFKRMADQLREYAASPSGARDETQAFDAERLFVSLAIGSVGAAEVDEKIRLGRSDYAGAMDLIEFSYESLTERLGPQDPNSIGMGTNVVNGYLQSGTNPKRALKVAEDTFAAWETTLTGIGLRKEEAADQRGAALIGSIVGFGLLDAHAQLKEPGKAARMPKGVFRAIQRLNHGEASDAAAREFARTVANRFGNGLVDLVSKRERISAQWSANETAIRESYSSRDEEAVMARERMASENEALEQEFARIETNITSRFPSYYAITQAQPVSPRVARKLLAKDEAVLIITPSTRGTHLALVTHRRVSWAFSKLDLSKLGQSVRRLRWYLGADDDFPEQDDLSFLDRLDEQGPLPFDFETAQSLYRELITPFKSELAGKTHLFVSATGAISSLPLGVLVSEVPSGPAGEIETLQNARWLADEFAIVRIPSLQALEYGRRFAPEGSSTDDRQKFIGFGAPDLEGSADSRGAVRQTGDTITKNSALNVRSRGVDVNGETRIDRASLLALSRLPGTELELREIARIFDAPDEALSLGAQASELSFKRMNFADTELLVLATHALVAGEIEGLAEPGLVFTPPNAETPDEDGFLSASEIAALRIEVQWAILSACNTAAGNGSRQGSALAGLAKSFLFAGTRNMLVSHWPVADAVAPRLTVGTLEKMRETLGLSRAQAFQQSMRAVRLLESEEAVKGGWAHPGFWAPFSFVGER